jgi:hypothetical protein
MMEKFSVGLLELETAVLECFLEKSPLSPLGVKAFDIILDMYHKYLLKVKIVFYVFLSIVINI